MVNTTNHKRNELQNRICTNNTLRTNDDIERTQAKENAHIHMIDKNEFREAAHNHKNDLNQ